MDNGTLIAILTCSGMWAVINTITAYIISRKQKAEDKATITQEEFSALVKGVRGLLYGELQRRLTEILKRGTVTADEIAEIHRYLYDTYTSPPINGDGAIKKLMDRVEQLDITD